MTIPEILARMAEVRANIAAAKVRHCNRDEASYRKQWWSLERARRVAQQRMAVGK